MTLDHNLEFVKSTLDVAVALAGPWNFHNRSGGEIELSLVGWRN